MCRTVNDSDPAPVLTITQVTNQFILGTTEVQAVSGIVTPAGSEITLASIPISGTFLLFKNGQLLTLESDYTIADDLVTLVVAPGENDVYAVSYIAQSV